jgi:alkyl hydroperoxide reductase subunit AhpC
VCPTEIIEFSKRAKDFRAINCEVLGCSVDSVHSHREYSKMPRSEGGLGELDIELLSDGTHQISKDYGVMVPELGFFYKYFYIIKILYF